MPTPTLPPTHFAFPGKRVMHAHEYTEGVVSAVVGDGIVLVDWDNGMTTSIPVFDLDLPC